MENEPQAHTHTEGEAPSPQAGNEAPSGDRTATGTAGTAPSAAGRPQPADRRTPWHRAWRALWFIPEPSSERWWRTWFVRSLFLLAGVLVLACLFIASYIGALHNPTPRDVPVGVVRGDVAARAVLDGLRADSNALRAVEYASPAAAESALRKRQVYAVLTFTSDAGQLSQPPATDTVPPQVAPAAGAALTVATGGGPSAVQVITDVVTTAATAASVPLTVTDIAPLSPADPSGLSPFYLVVGWILGGYLGATVLALSAGTVPRDFERAAMRLGALAVFSALAGLAGAVLAGETLGIWPGHVFGLTVVGALVTFAAAAATSALAGWLGMAGTGVAILLFVIVGNPGSGGIYAPELLPDFFRGLHSWVLPGLGVDLTRATVYFSADGPGRSVTGLVLYAALGVGGLLAATAVLGRRGNR